MRIHPLIALVLVIAGAWLVNAAFMGPTVASQVGGAGSDAVVSPAVLVMAATPTPTTAKKKINWVRFVFQNPPWASASAPVTRVGSLAIRVTVDPPVEGFIQVEDEAGAVLLQSTPVTQAEVTEPVGGGGDTRKTLTLDLKPIENRGPRAIRVRLDSNESTEKRIWSDPKTISFDTIGPRIDSWQLQSLGGGNAKLAVRFRDADLNPALESDPPLFSIKRAGSDQSFETAVGFTGPKLVGDRTVELTLTNMVTDAYRLTIINGAEGAKVSNDPNKALTDLAGNKAGFIGAAGEEKLAELQQFDFNSYPDPATGQHVEFPPFAPPAPQPIEVFNPDDRVETRVARLYYFRDAHRVAQIINRNVRSYNRAAVDQAERLAEDARDSADQLTDDRRSAEREAVRAAEELRRLEHEIEAAEDQYAKAVELQSQYDQADTEAKALQKQIDNLPEPAAATPATAQGSAPPTAPATDGTGNASESGAEDETLVDPTAARARRWMEGPALFRSTRQSAPEPPPAESSPADPAPGADPADPKPAPKGETPEQKRARLVQERDATNREADAVKRNLALYGFSDPASAVKQAQNKIAELRANLANFRQVAAQKNEDSLKAQAREDRARESQFRLEVAAANEDPDTYVAGKLDSVDPVTQVSISVVGEGLIQLRGPIKGINKIRTMINQLDAPVGQIKVGLYTAQLNGEHGRRLEGAVQGVEASVDVARFLTTQSLMMLRKSVEIEAAAVAEQSAGGDHYQVDRDRKYLYDFFGRDFIDELYSIDSEFLYTGNKVLALHSMDSISLHRALFIMALARNDVRQRILERFLAMVQEELPQMEYDFRCTVKHLPCGFHKQEKVLCRAGQSYQFRTLRTFFDSPVASAETMSPMQREFVRLAQIFKSQMVAELELKQRTIERGLIADRANLDNFRAELLEPVQREALDGIRAANQRLVEAEAGFRELPAELINLAGKIHHQMNDLKQAVDKLNDSIVGLADAKDIMNRIEADQRSNEELRALFSGQNNSFAPQLDSEYQALKLPGEIRLTEKGIRFVFHSADQLRMVAEDLEEFKASYRLNAEQAKITNHAIASLRQGLAKVASRDHAQVGFAAQDLVQLDWGLTDLLFPGNSPSDISAQSIFLDISQADSARLSRVIELVRRLRAAAIEPCTPSEEILQQASAVLQAIDEVQSKSVDEFRVVCQRFVSAIFEKRDFPVTLASAERVARVTRDRLDHRKLLDHLIDEQEEKWIELVEGTRGQIAAIDNYLKRLSIAIEDDLKVQFYDPSFVEMRAASRRCNVTLSQVERTTILTNNRAFCKVTPQATMEFDLPKRDILIQEAMKGAKAVVEDFGALLNDPTFLATAKLLSGQPPATTSSIPKPTGDGTGAIGEDMPMVKDVLTGEGSATDQQALVQSGAPERELGAALEALIPDPAIYKFETGTGFEIRPVIQPDGDSIVYDLDYMYTTNVREPVRADEKHLGRVKRHFIHTQVQTTSFEIREISRYQVALKAARTAKGVPLLEQIPVAGVLFKPLPSAESSIQQNIILGHSTVYPTLFDLMGLRWAPHVVDMDDASLRDAEHVVRGRRQTIENWVYDEASSRVDEFLRIDEQEAQRRGLHRPDLYRRQRIPSPYHPGGYTAEQGVISDPTGHDYRGADGRPPEMRQPAYDPRRHNPTPYELIDPSGSGEAEGVVPETLPDGIQYEVPASERGGAGRGSSRHQQQFDAMGPETLPEPPALPNPGPRSGMRDRGNPRVGRRPNPVRVRPPVGQHSPSAFSERAATDATVDRSAPRPQPAVVQAGYMAPAGTVPPVPGAATAGTAPTTASRWPDRQLPAAVPQQAPAAGLAPGAFGPPIPQSAAPPAGEARPWYKRLLRVKE